MAQPWEIPVDEQADVRDPSAHLQTPIRPYTIAMPQQSYPFQQTCQPLATARPQSVPRSFHSAYAQHNYLSPTFPTSRSHINVNTNNLGGYRAVTSPLASPHYQSQPHYQQGHIQVGYPFPSIYTDNSPTPSPVIASPVFSDFNRPSLGSASTAILQPPSNPLPLFYPGQHGMEAAGHQSYVPAIQHLDPNGFSDSGHTSAMGSEGEVGTPSQGSRKGSLDQSGEMAGGYPGKDGLAYGRGLTVTGVDYNGIAANDGFNRIDPELATAVTVSGRRGSAPVVYAYPQTALYQAPFYSENAPAQYQSQYDAHEPTQPQPYQEYAYQNQHYPAAPFQQSYPHRADVPIRISPQSHSSSSPRSLYQPQHIHAGSILPAPPYPPMHPMPRPPLNRNSSSSSSMAFDTPVSGVDPAAYSVNSSGIVFRKPAPHACVGCRGVKARCLMPSDGQDLGTASSQVGKARSQPHAMRCKRCTSKGIECVFVESRRGKRRPVEKKGPSEEGGSGSGGDFSGKFQGPGGSGMKREEGDVTQGGGESGSSGSNTLVNSAAVTPTGVLAGAATRRKSVVKIEANSSRGVSLDVSTASGSVASDTIRMEASQTSDSISPSGDFAMNSSDLGMSGWHGNQAFVHSASPVPGSAVHDWRLANISQQHQWTPKQFGIALPADDAVRVHGQSIASLPSFDLPMMTQCHHPVEGKAFQLAEWVTSPLAQIQMLEESDGYSQGFRQPSGLIPDLEYDSARSSEGRGVSMWSKEQYNGYDYPACVL